MAIGSAILFSGCKEEKQEVATVPYDPEVIPMIDSDSVTMLVSDSGVIRYKLVAKTWQFFEQAKDPHWYFPKGFYVEQFDSLFHIEVSIKSDTAWHYTKRDLWKLKGHIFVKNIKNETFSTEELYWDMKTKKIYSDAYIEIRQPDQLLLRGMGMEYNQSFTEGRILKPFNTEMYYNEGEY